MHKQKIQLRETRRNLRELPILRSNFEILIIFLFFVSLGSQWLQQHLFEYELRTAGQIRHLRSVCPDRSHCAQSFSLPLWAFSYIHHSNFPQLWDTAVHWFTSKISLLPFNSQHAMGLHFAHHTLVIRAPFASHQLFGNFLHLVLA